MSVCSESISAICRCKPLSGEKTPGNAWEVSRDRGQVTSKQGEKDPKSGFGIPKYALSRETYNTLRPDALQQVDQLIALGGLEQTIESLLAGAHALLE